MLARVAVALRTRHGLVHTGRCTAHSNTRRTRGNTHTQVTRTNKAGVAQAILASRLAKAKDCAGAQPLGHTCRACTIRNLRTYTEVCEPVHFSPLRTLAKQFSVFPASINSHRQLGSKPRINCCPKQVSPIGDRHASLAPYRLAICVYAG